MMIKMVNGIDLRNFLKLKFLILIFLLNFTFISAESKEKPWIGIQFTATTQKFIEFNKLDNSTPKNTIIITGVVETSAADEAGILPGDIVISVNNQSTKHPDDLTGILSLKKPNDILVFEIYRKGKKITKSIKLKMFPRL